nr:DNA mismatch repair enzyme [uncultured bacterium]
MRELNVSVGADHIEGLSKARKPLLAIVELIWNSLDADAKKVAVTITPNDLKGIDSLQVSDDGTGITPAELDLAFGQLGDSWKKTATRTKTYGRALHGKRGVGRYRAFALGGKTVWNTRYEQNGQNFVYEITFAADDKRRVFISDPTPTDEATGTTVTIFDPIPKFDTISIDAARSEITEHFAIYLQQYLDIELRYDGKTIKPEEVIETSADIKFSFLTEAGELEEQLLTVIEWKVQVERALFLCSREGFSYRELPAGIQAPGLQFTAYLRSRFIEKLADQDSIDIELGNLGKLLDETRGKLRDYKTKRQIEQASALVDEWKQEEIYPYIGTTEDPIEQTERQVFDVVAASVNKYLPDFKTSKKKSKQLTFNLLRHAIETSPSSLKKILEEVIGLPKEKQEELAALLDKTSLSSIISASKIVSDRLEFIQGLRSMLYDKPYKNALKERKHLQRLVAANTWLFGDEYFLMNDDESLLNVLKKHLEHGGYTIDDGLIDLENDVLFEGGGTGIVDLALTSSEPPVVDDSAPGTIIGKTLSRAGLDPMHNLVIELKRPTQKINPAVLQEVRDYAFAIARDERFDGRSTRWTFWALSNQLTEQAQEQATQRNLPPGVVFQSEPKMGRSFEYTIIAKTWAQVLDQAEQRLEFFRKHLDYSPSFSQGRAFLNAAYKNFIPEVAKEAHEEQPPTSGVELEDPLTMSFAESISQQLKAADAEASIA